MDLVRYFNGPKASLKLPGGGITGFSENRFYQLQLFYTMAMVAGQLKCHNLLTTERAFYLLCPLRFNGTSKRTVFGKG